MNELMIKYQLDQSVNDLLRLIDELRQEIEKLKAENEKLRQL